MHPYAWLVTGLLLVSTAGPFIKLARMDAFALVFLRLACAGPLFLAWAAAAGRPLGLPREHRARVLLGGALLASHFLLWVKAFDLTSFASNLLLLIAQPVMAALIGSRIGERPGRETWVALAVALAGLALIAKGDVELGPRALLGDLLSVLGGAAICLFYAVSRHARAALPIQAFMGWTLLAAAATALPVALLAGSEFGPVKEPLTFMGWTPTPWLWLGGLVLVTTMGGHGSMNAAARGVRLFVVNMAIVLEPPLAVLLGIAFLGETVTMVQVVGGAVLAVSVWIALLPEWRSARGPAAPPGIRGE
jgi:drug/metabolite transporter (DMT)-like permease